MAENFTWENMPHELLVVIGQKLGSFEDYTRMSAVCKSWQSALSKLMPFLPPESPLLLLAEKLPERALLGCDIDQDDDEDGHEEDNSSENESLEEEEDDEDGGDEVMEEVEEDYEEADDQDDEEDYEETTGDEEDYQDEGLEDSEEEDRDEDMEEVEEDYEENNGDENMEGEMEYEEANVGDEDDIEDGEEEKNNQDKSDERYDHINNSVDYTRGMYCLSTRKTHTIELPQASRKLILGTNKGWLVTLGGDFKINLLHPLLKKQISLPPMHTFPLPSCPLSFDYSSLFPREKFDVFLRRVAMSSTIQRNKDGVVDTNTPDPIIMTSYGQCGVLGFARLGDKVWTSVDIPSRCFEDLAYHKGKFYAIDCHGSIYICDIDDDDDRGGQAKGTKIAECPVKSSDDFDGRYLVESGSDLWVLVRIRKIKYFKPPHEMRIKYRTTYFSVWKLEQEHSEDGLKSPYTWIRKKNLDGKAFFIGRNTSVSLSSSVCIRPNCIYFTDDAYDLYYPDGAGGHDMGIFNVENGTIEPHFEGKSIHPISPPLWYI